MLVYDSKSASNTTSSFECTYTTFTSNNTVTSPEHPILVLDNSENKWAHHSIGIFYNPYKKTAFEFQLDGNVMLANILKVDSRFTSLIKWAGDIF